ncbi:uncharacterized protein LOC135225462 [Macrobrachium nipponense]|uniref:uncharacterized protein LOC135225462 n=1 Tax=Macrobrachium nipponense TaxID=159736 RepID=UPI0030C7BE4E
MQAKWRALQNSSTKREANVAGERQFVKSNNNDPKMSDCGDMQVNHTCASNKNNVNDKKDNRSSLFNGQSSTKPQTVAFDKAASSSPNVKFIKEVSKRVHKAMAMATTSTNNGAVSSSKSTSKVSSTSENSDAEKSTNEKKSIEDELKQEDEDGPWVNDEIKKQIDLRNGAYKTLLEEKG